MACIGGRQISQELAIPRGDDELDALATAGIVSRGTGRGEWTITDPLFADYLSAVLPHP